LIDGELLKFDKSRLIIRI